MEKVRLCDICDFQGGSQPPKDEWSFEQKDGYIRMLQIRDFTQTRNVEKEYIKLTSSTKTCEVDDILIARYGASVGKILTGLSGAYNVAIMKTIPNKRLLNKSYLKYYLLSDYFQNRINSVGERAAQAGFNKEDLSKLFISLVSLEEQKRIADELDNVSNLIDKRKQQLSKLDELVKARFVELFGGIGDSKIYPYKAVKELTDVISGGTPSREVNEYWEDGSIPWVKTTELQNNVITEIDEYITKAGLDNSSAKLVPEGTILIAMYGQGKTRGMTGYLGVEACTNQACACILPSGSINQKFLWQYFVLSYDNLRDMAKGGNQPNLNGNIIKNYPVLYPPIELQNQFAAFVEQTDKSKLEVQKSLEKLELLKKALMQKYFG